MRLRTFTPTGAAIGGDGQVTLGQWFNDIEVNRYLDDQEPPGTPRGFSPCVWIRSGARPRASSQEPAAAFPHRPSPRWQ